MRLTRLTLLLLALMVSVVTAPEAFGAKPKEGTIRHSKAKSNSLAAQCFDVYCYGYWADFCCGSVDYCLGYCDGTCGVPQGTCIYVQ